MANRRSFFERLTGSVKVEEEEVISPLSPLIDNDEEAQLSVDVYSAPSEIVIKTMVPGVKPEDLDVSITRDSVAIKGHRREERTVAGDDYLHRELYWGTFARTIALPEEIDVDEAEASEKHGMLVLRLPKLDKNKSTKLKIKGA